MYYYVNGKKVKHDNSSPPSASYPPAVYTPQKQNVGDSGGGCGKCPSWVFIILGVISALVAAWLVWCIIQERKKSN